MTTADLVVYGGKIATDYGVFDGTIVVRDGRISALEDADSRGPDAQDKIDATGKLVIPGCVDAHCHFDEPTTGETREGFESGTRSAAAGGVTTVLEHPLSLPPPADAQTFLAKKALALSHSVVDIGLIVRGRVVYDRGTIKVDPGFGQFVTPHRTSATLPPQLAAV